MGFLIPASGRLLRWHEMEDEHRVLILADPGAGKRFEARVRGRRIKERNKKAFFIRIETIDAKFEEAFESVPPRSSPLGSARPRKPGSSWTRLTSAARNPARAGKRHPHLRHPNPCCA